jgi:hypothetical protein
MIERKVGPRMLSRLSAFASLVFLASTQGIVAQPQFINTGDLLAAYDHGDGNARQLILLSVAQVEGGMALANAELKSKGAAPLYCVPSQSVLTGEQILDVLRRYASNHPEIEQSSYAVAILKAAEDVFPCRGS